MSQLALEVYAIGMYQTNCYLLSEDSHLVVIDPGDGRGALLHFLQQKQLTVDAVLVTHGHMDHFADAPAISEYYHCPILFPEKEVDYLSSQAGRRGPYQEETFAAFRAALKDRGLLLQDQSTWKWGEHEFSVRTLAGHSDAGACYYLPENAWLFGGDQLFCEGVGRMDLYSGPCSLLQEIRQKLLILPDQTTVFPGHGPSTTIEHEKKYNPYV